MEAHRQLLSVLADARLEGNEAAITQLCDQLAAVLGGTAAGVDPHGLWLRLELSGEPHRLRWIEPGRFLMGSPEGEQGRYTDESPQHEVTLSQGFWLGEAPLTQAQHEAITGDNPSAFQGEPSSGSRPVERVSWHEAVALCDRLSERSTTLRFRLPTEAQWEYAARAGTTTATAIGDLQIEDGVADLLDAIAWYAESSTSESTQPVSQLQPNAWGLFDVLGNVDEWCADHHDFAPVGLTPYPGPSRRDPLVVDGKLRIVRGSAWDDDASLVRSACRGAIDPTKRLNTVGLRLLAQPRPSP